MCPFGSRWVNLQLTTNVEDFQKHNHTVIPKAPDASNQNHVEKCHQTAANTVRAALIGANLSTNFWTCCPSHTACIFNSPPSQGQTASPIKHITNKKGDWTFLGAFGCHMWVEPPGWRLAKDILGLVGKKSGASI